MTCICLCDHCPKSDNLHHHIFGPLYPLLPLNPFPVITTMLSVSMKFCFCLFPCYFQFYIPHKWNYMVLNFFWLISLRMILSRSIHVVANGRLCLLLIWVGGGRERERERNSDRSFRCSTYLWIHWLLLVCALTGDGTCNLGLSGRLS